MKYSPSFSNNNEQSSYQNKVLMSALVWIIFMIFKIPGPLWAESNQRTPVVSPIKDTSYTELWCLLIVSLKKPSSCRSAGDEKPWRLYPISIQKWCKLERAPEHNYSSCWLCPNNLNHWRNMKSVIAVQWYCKFKSCLFAVMFSDMWIWINENVICNI